MGICVNSDVGLLDGAIKVDRRIVFAMVSEKSINSADLDTKSLSLLVSHINTVDGDLTTVISP